MKILKIIHGYPPLYNAGSEVYSQMLCHELVKHHEVHVFTREENPFIEDFSLRITHDLLQPKITLHVVNIPGEKYRYRYQHPELDNIFAKLLRQLQPDIVHIGHLNHLSTSLINEIAKYKIPIVYTLHDYWLMCPRGQFIQRNSQDKEGGLWSLCNAQEDRKCATQCYAGYFSGNATREDNEINYWSEWVRVRMQHIRDIIKHVDFFIAPSNYLRDRYISDFGLAAEKILYLDYGFDLTRLNNRNRTPHEPFTFGYIGTHIPAKGIQQLILAFGELRGEPLLRIWGNPRAQNTPALHAIAATLPREVQQRIYWLSEYRNEKIVDDVFNHVDCIVVPSIWVENSPLVIHEALQMRIPVITADAGGMAEYVHHEKNGLLFKHRDIINLTTQMQRLVDNPLWASQLGANGYLQSADNNIPNMTDQVIFLEQLYYQLIQKGQ